MKTGWKHRLQSGFTIIELMLVVTIIAIIASVAIPTYLNYATRTKAAEGLTLFSPAKKAVAEFGMAEARFPDNNAEAGLNDPEDYTGNHVESVTVTANGVVRVKFSDPGLQFGELVFTPSMVAGGSVRWVCSTAIPHTLVPKSCRN